MIRRPPINRPLALMALLGFVLTASQAGSVEETVTLKYTYRPETTSVTVLHDIQGKAYLPLNDVAQFYGIQMNFDSQTRRITLVKGKTQVRMVLSQPVFLTVNPEASYPIEPVEVVAGQLGIPPEGAEAIIPALLNIDARYLPDQKTFAAGGVKVDELRKEILAEAQQPKAPMAEPTPTAAPVTAAAAPAPTAEPEEEDKDDQEAQPLPPRTKEENAPSANQVYRVRRIIIDPGHGGRDAGARGFDKRYCEKQATLDIATRVAEILKEDPNLQVYMTRTADYFITLKYRCEFANRHNGDVFVSIHCNANPKSKSTGTETYYYSPRPSNKLAAVAAVNENGGSRDLAAWFADLHQNAYKARSFSLAEEVDRRIRDRLKQHIRHIQHAPFYVLRQVDMPSILVETAFITNPKEEVKLRDPYWRDKIAQSIADGVLSFRDTVEGTSENQQARR